MYRYVSISLLFFLILVFGEALCLAQDHPPLETRILGQDSLPSPIEELRSERIVHDYLVEGVVDLSSTAGAVETFRLRNLAFGSDAQLVLGNIRLSLIVKRELKIPRGSPTLFVAYIGNKRKALSGADGGPTGRDVEGAGDGAPGGTGARGGNGQNGEDGGDGGD